MISFFHRLLDFFFPRFCTICGNRLTITEEIICASCNRNLPRTKYAKNPYENEMAKLFWARFPIEKASAMIFFQPHSEVSRLIYSMKYFNHPEIAQTMGREAAQEFKMNDFFNDIDFIIPVPLAKVRERKRGYNQSLEIAKGVSEETKLEIRNDIVKRVSFKESQTKLSHADRADNVENAFKLIKPEEVYGKHILLIDDIVTTGSTIVACGKELARAGKVKISVLSLGLTKD